MDENERSGSLLRYVHSPQVFRRGITGKATFYQHIRAFRVDPRFRWRSAEGLYPL